MKIGIKSYLQWFLWLVFVASIGLFIGCSETEQSDSSNLKPEDYNSLQESNVESSSNNAEPSAETFQNYRETGDLAQIQQRGILRLITPARQSHRQPEGLPRRGLPVQVYKTRAEKFAASLGLTPQWIIKDSLESLIPALLAGEGDIIVNHLTQTPARAKQVRFTVPVSQAQEFFVTGKSAEATTTDSISTLSQLQDKHLLVPAGSSYAETAQTLSEQLATTPAAQNPAFNFHWTERVLDANPDHIIDLVNAGEFDATLLDGQVIEQMSLYRKDFTKGMAASELRPVSWAVRPDSVQLQGSLDRYLTATYLSADREQLFAGDFSAIKKRGRLRMITRNNPVNYFLWRGELMGFEYDLIKKFADLHQLELEVVVAPPEVDMIDWLNAGHGDLIASAMTVTEDRAKRTIAFTRFYNQVTEQLVSGMGSKPVNQMSDLAGRTLVINDNTAYWATGQKLVADGQNLTLLSVSLSTEDILSKLANGEFSDLSPSVEAKDHKNLVTIADSHLVAIESRFNDSLIAGMTLEPAKDHAWAVNQQNTELLAALNQFLNREYRGLFFNVTANKYFKASKKQQKYLGGRLASGERLSPYDDLVKPAAEQYQFDWRLLVSQMYQESRFDPTAKSFAGALGLFQVMPRTAKEMGYRLPFTEETGIMAGSQYLNWTRDRFEDYLPLADQLWFSLAAYNAGFGHVNDARRLARHQGWDGNRWFDNVEKAMLLLSKRQYYHQARYGYVRGSEPVNYVRSIRDRYLAYLALEQDTIN